MRITIAGMQAAGSPDGTGANLVALGESARAARERGAQLLITPEMFVTGYNMTHEDLDAATTPDLPDRVAAIAREAGIAILAGLPERVPGGIANSTGLFDEHGTELARYRKTHLFGDLDRLLFVAGDRLPAPVELHGVRLAPLICYDVEFPEAVRALVLAGADLIVVPTAQMEPYAYLAEHLVRVRAWENQTYLAYVNRTGAEGELHYVGRSSIVAPDGTVLDSRGADDEGLVVATVDTELAHTARERNPYLADRRPELYRNPPFP